MNHIMCLFKIIRKGQKVFDNFLFAAVYEYKMNVWTLTLRWAPAH